MVWGGGSCGEEVRKTRRVRVRPSIIMPKDSAACNL